MSFENLVLGFELNPALLGGTPAFRIFAIRDKNPLSKREKGRRPLEAPNNAMRIIHGRLIKYLRSLKVEMPYATACRPGDSPLKNVERHRQSRFFCLLDLRRAYQSVQVGKLASVLHQADPRLKGQFWEVRAFLQRYCMSQTGGVPAGAPASPDLFNLYCAVLLDEKIGNLCRQHGLIYTRYVDDLTISGNITVSRRVRAQVRAIIASAGFKVNHLKSQTHDLQKSTLVINGIGLELGGRVFVPPFYLRHVRGLLHEGLKGDLSLAPKIQGAMSVVLGIVNQRKPTASEQRVLRQCKRFRRLIGQTKREQRKAPASV